MNAIVQTLERLGVDIEPKEHKAYKFKSDGWMDLIIETWQIDGITHVVMAHYGQQNGDAMADPDIEFRLIPGINMRTYKPELKVHPIHYQNDYVGIYQEATIFEGNKILISKTLHKSINSFLVIWCKNIRAQGFAKN